MRVAVVGAGFTGLSAAITLSDSNVQVDVYETAKKVGGLAGGMRLAKWKWNLEFFYHHIFFNDTEIIDIAKKVGNPPIFFEPQTSSLINGKILQLDSPMSVLKFREISLVSRIRMGLGLAFLKVIPNGVFFEKYKVVDFLPKLIGQEAYKKIWGKLLKAKFGSEMNQVNMAWFWSRVAKRTKKLGYFEGGFQQLAESMQRYAEKRGANFFLNKEFDSEKMAGKYDKILLTTPGPLADKIAGKKVMPEINYLWGQTLVLELKKKLMKSYWLNVLEDNWPFLVAVEHTEMVSKSNYDKKTIIYLGNYLENENEQLKMTDKELLKKYTPFIKKINPDFSMSWVNSVNLFRRPYAQPVFPTNYSKLLSRVPTKLGKYYFANMSMVYPFDRGTNYAVKMGTEVAKSIISEK